MRTVKKNTMRNWLRHRLHPMHIYCRLCTKRDDHQLVGKICIWYESYIWRWMKHIIELLPK